MKTLTKEQRKHLDLLQYELLKQYNAKLITKNQAIRTFERYLNLYKRVNNITYGSHVILNDLVK